MAGYDGTVPQEPRYASNAEGIHAVAEARRRRRYQREQGLCCSGGDLCGACESEAEAIKEAKGEW